MYSKKPPQPPKQDGFGKTENDPITAGLVQSYMKKNGMAGSSTSLSKPPERRESTLRNSGYA
jgi:hypothetical protein